MSGVIVHEWIARFGGSENVVDQLAAMFPDAELRVLWVDAPERLTLPTRETWLARTPLRRSKALAVPFMLPTWRHLPARQPYDW
ncbi:MAG: hypothetical protein LBR27_06670, partial [Bifidobacteriaceae bacterium]|nr:hypothetical protein [Bifidobacteriaceae bacterium]